MYIQASCTQHFQLTIQLNGKIALPDGRNHAGSNAHGAGNFKQPARPPQNEGF
jgi:hypothetical protein